MKMKQHESFAAFQADQPAPIRSILRKLRTFVRKTSPALTESVKWGNGCWVGEQGPVAFAHVEADHVQFGFFAGAQLADPDGLLHGKGKFIRHVKIASAAQIDEKALAPLLREATKLGHPTR